MKISVYGLGKLGLPLASVLARSGHDIQGYDQDTDTVAWCAQQKSLERSSMINIIDEPDVWVAADNLTFHVKPQPADMNFIVVPTPSLDSGEFDSRYVEDCLADIYLANEGPTIAVVVSTTFPGTCERLFHKFADRITLVYNPTFIALGSVVSNLVRPSMLLYGADKPEHVRAVQEVWGLVLDARSEETRHIGSFTEAELLKLSINCALATKISLANSLGELFTKWDVDPAAVAVIGQDPRIGTAFMMPGVPISGPCLPRDNKALRLAAYKKQMRLPLSEATEDVDFDLRVRLYTQIFDACLSVAAKHSNRIPSVGIVGMTYKYGVPLLDGSVGSWLKERCEEDGYDVRVWDDWALEGSDELGDVLGADVIVFTHKELTKLAEHTKGKVIDVWA